MKKLFIDLETRSAVDLKQCGVYVYGESPSTEILMWAWCIDDAPMQIYYPVFQEKFPDELREVILDPETVFVAHNAGFERIVLSLVGRRWLPPEIHAELRKIDRWSCTASRARACGLPGALDLTAIALHLKIKKDKEGHRLMLRMCKPAGLDMQGKPIWYGTEADMLRLGDYCKTDVEVERLIDGRVPELDKTQKDLYVLVEKMNDRGILVDNDLLMKLVMLTEDAVLNLNASLKELTNGKVQRVSNASALADWLVEQGYDDVQETGIGAPIISDMLLDADLNPIVREALIARRDGGRSSTAKLKNIANRENQDRRIRGNLMFAGAPSSGRLSSTGAQLQNLPRNKQIKDIKSVVQAVVEDNIDVLQIKERFGPPMVVVSELLRPTFIARDGYWLARGDLGQIEARFLPWLAGAEDTLEAYRRFDAGLGPDIYIVTAANALNMDYSSISHEQRQLGKLMSLSFGYAGGMKAFQRFAKIYNVRVPDEKADEYKNKWREANPNIVQFWSDIEKGALRCLRAEPGTICKVRENLWFKRNNSTMVMRLPSGRNIFLWYPKIENMPTPWGSKDSISFFTQNNVTKQWSKEYAYGGMLTALAVQGSSTRDIIAYMMLEAENAGLNPLMCVHDEIICEVSKERFPTADSAAEAVKTVMLAAPPWCLGLPIVSECSAGPRYLK